MIVQGNTNTIPQLTSIVKKKKILKSTKSCGLGLGNKVDIIRHFH